MTTPKVTGVTGSGISVTNSASVTSFAAAGQQVTYIYAVTNNSGDALHTVDVTDSTGVRCDLGELSAGETETCKATYITSAADVATGKVANTATASGLTPANTTVTDQSTVVIPLVKSPAISITKTASVTSFAAAGQAITYTYTVTNNGNVPLTGLIVTDATAGAPARTVCAPAPGKQLTAGATATCKATYLTTAADVAAGVVANTAAVTADAPGGGRLSARAGIAIPVAETPGITVVKSASIASFADAGAKVTYTYTVTNIGDVPLHGVKVTDTTGADCKPMNTLDVGSAATCTATYYTTAADVAAGHAADTATASGQTSNRTFLFDSYGLSIPLQALPAISITKTASVSSFSAAGQAITVTYTVTNNGNVPLTGVTVTDATAAGTGPAKTICALAPGKQLAAGTTATCTATYYTTAADVAAGQAADTATVSGLSPGGATVTSHYGITVPLEARPAISITKTASVSSFSAAGQAITVTYTVTNNGNVPLTGVTVTDATAAGTGPAKTICALAPGKQLAAGTTATCTATYYTTAADVAARQAADTATVSGLSPGGATVTSHYGITVPLQALPAISITKTASVTSFSAAGQPITVTYTVTNNGNVPLHGVTVTDTIGARCDLGTLAAGAATTCTAPYLTTAADVTAGQAADTATVSGLSPAGATASGHAGLAIPLEALPAISITKTASATSFSAAGHTIIYTYTVTNNGNVPLHGVTVTDTIGARCDLGTLAAGAATTCTAPYLTTAADVTAGQAADTATVSGQAPGGATASGKGALSLPLVRLPAISITSIASVPDFTAAGQTITYTYTVTNNGNVPLHAITITNSTGARCDLGTLAAGATAACTVTHDVTTADVTAGQASDTATVSGLTPGGATVGAKSALDIPLARRPGISVEKIADVAGFAAAGTVITYIYRVTNTGNVPFRGVAVTDTAIGAIGCPSTMLAVGASMDCQDRYITTPSDATARQIANAVAVTATTPRGATSSATAAVDIPLEVRPAVSVEKIATVTIGRGASQRITYSYLVTDNGNVPLHNVTVTDNKTGHVCGPLTLAVGQTTTCTATVAALAGDLANTGTVTGATPSGAVESDESALVIEIAQRPQVRIAKTANMTAFTRAGTLITYSYKVINTGNVALHGVTVSDSKIRAVRCPRATLAAGASMTCTARYAVTRADMAAGRVTNTASLTSRTPAGAKAASRTSLTIATTVPVTG